MSRVRARRTRERALYEPNWQMMVTLTFACALVFLPVFFRGLFFESERLPFIAASSVLTVFIASWKKDFKTHHVDLPLLILALSYLMSLAFAVWPRAAIDRLLTQAFLLTVYVAVATSARVPRGRIWLLLSVHSAAVLAGLIGFLGGAGLQLLPGVFSHGRLFSPLQYPNSAASFLAAAFLCSLALQLEEVSPVLRYHLVGGSSIILAAFFLTYSRGAWLVHAPLMIVALLLCPRDSRARAAGFLATCLIGASAILPLASMSFSRAKPEFVVLAAVMGYVIASILHLLSSRLRYRGLRPKMLAAVSIIVAVVFIAGMIATGAGTDLLTRGALRLSQISLTDEGGWQRIEWTKDAIRIFAKYPVFGAGGGAWEALYKGFQSWGYSTQNVHNDWAQLATETGLIGLAAFTAFWIILTWKYAALRRLDYAETGVATFIYAAALGLTVHSLMDFNMALVSVGVLLWTCFALLRAIIVERIPSKPFIRLPAIAVLLVGLTLCLASTVFFVGHIYGQQGALAMQEGRYDESVVLFKKASKWDPLNASFHMDIGQIYEAMGLALESPDYLGVAVERYEKGLALSPFNPDYHAIYGSFLLRVGTDPYPGIQMMNRAVELHPYNKTRYEHLAKALNLAALRYITMQRFDEARDAYLNCIKTLDSISRANSQIRSLNLPRGDSLLITPTPEHLLEVAKAYSMIGRLRESMDIVSSLERVKAVQDTARVLKAAILLYMGEEDEANKVLNVLPEELRETAAEYVKRIELLSEFW